MEEKYGGCMREMESLIDQFRARVMTKEQAHIETRIAKGMLVQLSIL